MKSPVIALRAAKRSTPKRLQQKRRAPIPELACIGCGCTENHACEDGFGGGCYWISQNARTGRGLCSECAIKMANAILFAS
jgi:hypothetical protein